ncbi:MAG: AI-2E family transporter, partial [Clostridia bacterium]|nr:AI-2E family transporter [Clostridia bacterium]
YIFMLIMDMEYAVLISVIIGVTNIIPFFGPFIGGIPSVFIMMLADPWDALILAVFLVVLQQFDGNFLGPKLMGDTMGIRAVFVVFSVIVFGGLFGIVGMFIGVPLFVVLYTLFAQAITAQLNKKKIQIK